MDSISRLLPGAITTIIDDLQVTWLDLITRKSLLDIGMIHDEHGDFGLVHDARCKVYTYEIVRSFFTKAEENRRKNEVSKFF